MANVTLENDQTIISLLDNEAAILFEADSFHSIIPGKYQTMPANEIPDNVILALAFIKALGDEKMLELILANLTKDEEIIN